MSSITLSSIKTFTFSILCIRKIFLFYFFLLSQIHDRNNVLADLRAGLMNLSQLILGATTIVQVRNMILAEFSFGVIPFFLISFFPSISFRATMVLF